MKRIVNNRNTSEIDVSDATPMGYVGCIRRGTLADKGFLFPISSTRDEYKFFSIEGNNFGYYNGSRTAPFKLFIRDFIAAGYEAYYFDTKKELFTWLAKD